MQNSFRLANKKEAILLPYRQDIANILPFVACEKGATKMMLVPHRIESCKLLKNFGYDIPSPILTRYDWNNTTPFESQKITAAMLAANRRAFLLSEIGCGKSRAVLYAIDYLKQRGEINKVLVVAPLSILSSVWEAEVFEVTPYYDTVALHGTKAQRLAALKTDVDFYIINHDGVAVIEETLKNNTDINCVVIDELAAFRNARTKRWRVLNRVIKGRKFVWGLTGAPIPGSVMDCYGQVKLLVPNNVPKHERPLRNRLMTQVSTFRWVPRPGATEEVYKLMQPSIRFTRDEVYDLPPVTYSDRETPLSVDQKKIYRLMMDKFMAQYQNDEITAANEGVKLGKLLQISCGYVYNNDREKVVLPGTARLDVLKEVIEEAGSKVIVFVPFIHALLEVVSALEKVTSVRCVYGATKKSERDEIFHSFQHEDAPNVLVAHPQTVSHGLTLTAASVIVWFSPTNSLETYVQANGRITRYGQKLHSHIIHLIGSQVEAKVYKRLKNKQSAQDLLLDMFKMEGTDMGV